MNVLQASAINESNVESSIHAILAEWLGNYFDGAYHQIGTTQAPLFPACTFSFGQGPANQGKATNLPDIRLVVLPRAECALHNVTILAEGKLACDQLLFQFWVTSKAQGTGAGQFVARQVAELLAAILRNPDTRYPLCEKGLLNFEPQAPKPIQDATYDRYMVACSVEAQYPIEFSLAPAGLGDIGGPTIAIGGPQNIQFLREEVCVVGDYLAGNYSFTAPVTLSDVRAVGWASQNEPTVFALEIGGVLTDTTVTMAAGEPDEDVVGVLSGLDVVIPQGQSIRWLIQSGPADAESAAWHVSIGMTVNS